MENIKKEMVKYLDQHLGENSEATCNFRPMRDAVEWQFFTTIKGARYRFDYYYPFWDIQNRQTRHYAAEGDPAPMLNELKLVCRRAFGWRYAFVPPEYGGVIDINGERS